jgi:hypothetical protein
MTQQDYTHPTTPPPELRSKWFNEASKTDLYDYIIEQAVQWGADQELETCCEWLADENFCIASDQLRDARRPKSPSLKEKLTEALYNENIGEALRLVDQLDD